MYASFRWIFSLAVVSIMTPGCRGCEKESQTIALLADAAPAPSFDIERPVAKEFLSDALWRKAMEDDVDALDLAALGDREGAIGLLEAMEQGGKVGKTALLALPHAPDAPVALRRLAELALLTKGHVQYEIISCVHQILWHPPSTGEPLDEGGREAVVEALLLISQDEKNAQENRALAGSSLRSQALKGLVEEDKIPTSSTAPKGSSSAGEESSNAIPGP